MLVSLRGKGLRSRLGLWGHGNAEAWTLARSGHFRHPVKQNTVSPYILPFSTTLRAREAQTHRATIQRCQTNPYPYCLPAKASVLPPAPCGFAFPPPPSACLSFDTHLCLSLLPIPHFKILSHYACLFPLLFTLAPAPFHFTSVSLVLVLLAPASFSCRRAPDQVSRECMRQLHVHPHVLSIAC
jgi:hypothetical protein